MAEAGPPDAAQAAQAAEAAEAAAGAVTAVPAEPPLRVPASAAELFKVFTRLALQGFGGVLPIAHRELVERERWLSPQQFMDLLVVGQVLPGPNIVNISMILGHRWFGLRGALAASAGLLAVPLAIVLVLAVAYQQAAHLPLVAGALRGMGAVAAGLVIATGLKLARTLKDNPLGAPLGWALALLTTGAVVGLRWPLVAVVAVLGGSGMALAAWRLHRSAAAATGTGKRTP